MSRTRILATTLAVGSLSVVPAAGLTPAAGATEPTAAPPAASHAEPLPEPAPLEAYLADGRFRLLATWQTADGAGDAVPLPLTADTAAFWFFRPDNLELMVKVLDACPANQRFWVFAAGLTNVGVPTAVDEHDLTLPVLPPPWVGELIECVQVYSPLF